MAQQGRNRNPLWQETTMPMNTNLSIDTPFIFDAANMEEQIAYGNGGVHVRFEVYGYWSDVVTLRVKREFNWRAEEEARAAVWTVDVSHSSGGREPSVSSDLIAERCFAKAIVAACDLGESLAARRDEMEAAYQARREIDRAAQEARNAEHAAKLAADPAIGAAPARAYIDALVENTRQLNGSKVRALRARVRGSDSVITIVARRSWNDKIQLRFGGSAIGRKEAATKLADLAFAGLVPDVKLGDNELLNLDRSFN